MQTPIRSLLTALAVVCAASTASAVALYQQDVYCGEDFCGTMQIDTYSAQIVDGNKGGVEIAGGFDADVTAGKTFHYLQVVTVDDDPLDFVLGGTLSAPYVDTPPGGYAGDPWDLLPYYDEGEFPSFYDFPTNFLSHSEDAGLTGGDGQLNLSFETWLVCVVDETYGATANRAFDDTFTVAPLVGFTWGFNIAFVPDDPMDPMGPGTYNVTRDAFAWIAGQTPTATFQTGLGAVYGSGPGNPSDWFNVTLTGCENCVPEPSTDRLALAVVVALALVATGTHARR